MTDVITLSLRPDAPRLLDLDGITPDACAQLSPRDLPRQRLVADGREAALGDVFDVRGAGAPRLRLVGDLAHASRVGAGMRDGALDVRGDVGDDAGVGMSGGVLRISGKAGDRLAAAAPGAARGMTGGEVVVTGDCGREAAARARRGLVLVGGNAGDDAARGIIAGTLVVLGRTGTRPGRGSKRGSIVSVGHVDVPDTYRYACTFEPAYLRLLFTYVRRRYGLAIADAVVTGRYRRYCGDLGTPGKGEILAWTGA